jgi:hypothetical protein
MHAQSTSHVDTQRKVWLPGLTTCGTVQSHSRCFESLVLTCLLGSRYYHGIHDGSTLEGLAAVVVRVHQHALVVAADPFLAVASVPCTAPRYSATHVYRSWPARTANHHHWTEEHTFVVAVANGGALSAGQRVSISVGAGRASLVCHRLSTGAGVSRGILFSSVIICAGRGVGTAGGSRAGDRLPACEHQEEAGHQHAQLQGETNAGHLWISFCLHAQR